MRDDAPETMGFRGATYVRADVVEGRVREERREIAEMLMSRAHAISEGAEAFDEGMSIAYELSARAVRFRTRPALASPSDISGEEEGGGNRPAACEGGGDG